MSLTDEQRKIIIELELERSDNMMSQIPALQELGYCDTVANRLYYALFHAVTAMFIYDGLDVSTHRGMVRNFGIHYVQQECSQGKKEGFTRNFKPSENWLTIIANTIQPWTQSYR